VFLAPPPQPLSIPKSSINSSIISPMLCISSVAFPGQSPLDGINLSRRRTKDVAHSSKSVEKLSAKTPMTDTYIAQELMQESFPIRAGRNAKAAIGSAYKALKAHERALPNTVLTERPRAWTERRVRAIWNREAKRIDNYEIDDLTAIAIQEARIELKRSAERAARLEALLADPLASEMGAQVYRRGQRDSRVDSP
jgi:hypothetical protein